MRSRRLFLVRCPGATAFAAALLLGGCSSKVTRNVDVGKGEYYNADEVARLKKDKYQSYCAALDAELNRLQAATASARTEAEKNAAQVASVQAEVHDLESRTTAAKGESDKLQAEVTYFENLPKSWTVKEGEFLARIAANEEIYADKLKWPRLYRANRDKIHNPNVIHPGWVLTIPRDWPHSWTVSQGEFLSRIAGYWEVFDQRSMWPKLFEANRDRIKDPNLIMPGWVLTIPREGSGGSERVGGR
jgi:nucleoid-associated protein YgaU